MFSLKQQDGKARCGELKVKQGSVKTPFFMPVATFASGRGIGPEDYKKVGVQCCISNGFLLLIS